MRIANAVMWMCAMGLGACAVVGKDPGAPPPERSAAPAAATAAASTSSLVGTRWTGVVPGADPRSLPRLEFATEGRVVGFTGCNMLSGAWSMAGGEVKFGPMVTTKRGCMGIEGDIEKRVLGVLGSNSRVTREAGKLILTGPDGSRFEFVEAAAS